MAKFSSPPAGPLAAGLESDFCRCRLEVLHVFQNFTPRLRRLPEAAPSRRLDGHGIKIPALGALGVAVISLTSRAGELRSAPSGPDDRDRVTG